MCVCVCVFCLLMHELDIVMFHLFDCLVFLLLFVFIYSFQSLFHLLFLSFIDLSLFNKMRSNVKSKA